MIPREELFQIIVTFILGGNSSHWILQNATGWHKFHTKFAIWQLKVSQRDSKKFSSKKVTFSQIRSGGLWGFNLSFSILSYSGIGCIQNSSSRYVNQPIYPCRIAQLEMLDWNPTGRGSYITGGSVLLGIKHWPAIFCAKPHGAPAGVEDGALLACRWRRTCHVRYFSGWGILTRSRHVGDSWGRSLSRGRSVRDASAGRILTWLGIIRRLSWWGGWSRRFKICKK